MKMQDVELAYEMGVLFDKKITSFYYASFRGSFGKVQIDVFSYLYKNREVTGTQLIETINVPKQHISKIIKRLESDGLVESRPGDTDKRTRLISLTAQGRELVEEHIRVSNRHFLEVTGGLAEEEREQLRGAIETIIAVLEKVPE